jgi:hypothetical protein
MAGLNNKPGHDGSRVGRTRRDAPSGAAHSKPDVVAKTGFGVRRF